MADAHQLSPVEVRVVERVACALQSVDVQNLPLAGGACVCKVVPRVVIQFLVGRVGAPFPSPHLRHAVFESHVSVVPA